MRLAVLVSGRGTNLQALIDACSKSDYPAEISVVISNKPGVAALERAAKVGIKAVTVNHKDFDTKADFEAAMQAVLEDCNVQLVCLAGFMRLLSAEFVNSWRDRLINIHPSLLPSFRGLDTHARAIEAGVKITGCTIHYVRPEMDEGPIIMQGAVPVMDSDTPESLGARVLEVENQLYPEAVRRIAKGAIRITGHKVVTHGEHDTPAALINPTLQP